MIELVVNNVGPVREMQITTDSASKSFVSEKVVKVVEVNNNFPSGKSAFETAVDNGFVGTEVQWLESLRASDIDGGIIF